MAHPFRDDQFDLKLYIYAVGNLRAYICASYIPMNGVNVYQGQIFIHILFLYTLKLCVNSLKALMGI